MSKVMPDRPTTFNVKKPVWQLQILTTAQITPDYCTSSQLHNLRLTIAHFTTAQITSNNCTFLADNFTISVLRHAIANPVSYDFQTQNFDVIV